MTKTIKALAVLGVVAGLGVAALPIAGASAAEIIDGEGGDTKDGVVTDDTTFTLDLADKLSITASTNAVAITPAEGVTYAGSYQAEPMTVKVYTRNAKGYKLTIVGSAGSEQNNATVKDALTNEKGNTIAAGTLGDADTASSWGYKAQTTIQGGTISALPDTWTAVSTTDTQIMTSDKNTLEGGDVATLTFGAKIVDGQAAGTYKGKVTFTATNLPVAQP